MKKHPTPTPTPPPVPFNKVPYSERSYYLPGDGDTPTHRRPGSDHSKYKSKGVRC